MGSVPAQLDTFSNKKSSVGHIFEQKVAKIPRPAFRGQGNVPK
jgi:hypothetical protein